MKLGQQQSRAWFMMISLIYSERMMLFKKIKNNWKLMTSWLWSWSWCQWWWVLMRRSQIPLMMLMMYLFQVMTTAFRYVPRHTADDMIYIIYMQYWCCRILCSLPDVSVKTHSGHGCDIQHFPQKLGWTEQKVATVLAQRGGMWWLLWSWQCETQAGYD